MPKLLPRQYARILHEVTKGVQKQKLDSVIETFILFLAKERVLHKIEFIIKEFIAISKEAAGVKTLKVTSARKLSKETMDKVCDAFGAAVEMEAQVDPELLGGLVVQDGYTVLDASVKRQLETLKQKLVSFTK